jgi:neutral ceramidase
MPLLAGLSRRDITPPLGLPLDGYDARTAPARGVLDRLAARVLYLHRGEQRACLLSLELLGVRERFADRLRRAVEAATGVPRSAVVVAASHTHAGPAGIADARRRSTGLARYADAVVEQTVTAAVEAQRSARACTLRLTQRATEGIAANRVDPGATCDPCARILRLEHAASGSPLGLAVHFACHPTVLGEDNLCYSGDLVGRALTRLEGDLGVPCLFLQGAAADVSTRFTRRARSAAEAERLGQALAATVHEALGERGHALTPSLAVGQQPVRLPRRAPPDRRNLDVLVRSLTEDLRRAADDRLAAGLVRRLEVRLSGARHLLDASVPPARLAGGAPARPASEAQARSASETQANPASDPLAARLIGLSLGGLALAAIPGELFHATAAAIPGYGSDWLPVTLANGYLGYFPTAASIAAQAYESLYTPFGDAATAELARGIERLIESLRSVEAAPGASA